MSYQRSSLNNIHVSEYNLIRDNYNNYPVRGSYKNMAQRADSYNESTYVGYGYQDNSMKRNSIAKIQNLRKQFHDVIDLCKGQNIDVKGQLNNVVQAERDIYNMLLQNPQQLQRIKSQQSISHPPQSLNRPSTFINREQSTPIMQKNPNYIPQSIYYIPHFSQVGTRQAPLTNSKIQKQQQQQQSVYIPVIPVQDQYYPMNDQNMLKNSFNLLKKSNQVMLNDDALKLIQQIEKKAFQQIQKLRKQKIQLMQKLNQQIRNTNDERKKNLELQNQLHIIRNQHQQKSGGFAHNQTTQDVREYQLHINRLEDQLKRVNQINNHLKIQLNHRGAGVSGIQQLLRQGQLIRQQTLRLLKLKQAGSKNNSRIIQLERQLYQQRADRQTAIQEIKNLRQKVNGGSRSVIGQSKITRQPQPYVKSMVRIQSPTLNRGSNQYDQMLSQMKRITGY